MPKIITMANVSELLNK